MHYEPSPTDIAVIGMSCRFPGAANPSEFWRNIRDGKESVTTFSDAELLAAGVSKELLAHPDYVKAGVVFEDLAQFDAGFFGFSPKDAAIMDPQHRHFLECSWEALEHAGYTPEGFPGAIGVFAGCGMNAYFMFNLLTNQKLVDSVGMFLLRHTGNDKDFLSTRVSYCLNLRGPSINVQTACSTSLVAIHAAAQSLLNGECNLALAGGVTIELPHHRGYLYQEGEILSRDGHCRAFDHRSSGTIFGSGAGVVVLRRMSDALENGDTIHAVLRGSALNNDGSQKVGYLAPSVDGQAGAVAEALAVAGVDADSISYVAAHGTATAVGDPIEVSALTQAFRRTSNARNFCALGSVKTNIGHLDTAAGVASFILAVEALKNRQLPPSLHFEKPNPLIDFAGSPFYVNATLKDWTAGAQPRRAGVSSLGVGGTNAHCILEEAPPLPAGSSSRPFQLLPVSARSEQALEVYCRRFAGHLREHPELSLADVAFTAQTGRRSFRHRRFVVASDTASAIAALESRESKAQTGAAEGESPVLFLFPGGGAQYPNMGLDLYRDEPVYRQHVDECLRLVQPQLAFDLRSQLFPAPERMEEAARELERPLASILAIFITEYAMAQLWLSWGVRPKALTGHSLGEYTAACLAGMLSLEDALALVVARGLIFEKMPGGAMLSVHLPEAELRALIDNRFDLAVVNATALGVVSGEMSAIEELARSLEKKEIECTRVRINVAAHSRMLDPYLAEFAAIAERVVMKAPEIPVVSNLTGQWMDATTAADRQYWVKHLRCTVRFAQGMDLLLQENSTGIFLEAGPGSTLTSLVRQHAARKAAHVPVASMRHPKEAGSDSAFALAALGRVWAHGGRIAWDEFRGQEQRRRVPLPTYPFEHQRYWIEPGRLVQTEAPPAAEAPVSGESGSAPLLKQASLEDWLYSPAWRKLPQPEIGNAPTSPWLIYTYPNSWGSRLAEYLRQTGQAVVELEPGEALRPITPDHYIIDDLRESFHSLVHQLIDNGRVPRRIVHCLGIEPAGDVDRGTQDCFHSLVYLTQALAEQDLMQRLEITVVTRSLFGVAGSKPENPLAALALGPARVIPQEFPGNSTLVLDVEAETPPEKVVPQLIARRSEAVAVLALRGNEFWVQEYRRGSLNPASRPIAFRQGATYLITGGLGGAGFTLARLLARNHRSSLILLNRNPLPPKESWEEWIEQHGLRDPVSRRIAQVRELEAYGSPVVTVAADVADEAELRCRLSPVLSKMGPVHGVIHTAGTIDDQPLMLKTVASAEEVLAPKVKGTLALARVLETEPLEFFLAFSSTSALLGLAGQVDYTAANAFLDAYAAHRRAAGAPYVSINWGVWNGVGMAARAMDVAEGEIPPAAGDPTGHPMLGFRAKRSASGVTFAANWTDSLWVLNEHRLSNGAAFLPGTGYVEMIRAAAEHSGFPALAGALEIRDLSFEEAISFGSGDTRQVWITLQETGDHWDCLISSLSIAGSRRRHAHCELRPAAVPAGGEIQWEDISRRCGDRVVRFARGEQRTRQEDHLRFGPRWKVLRTVWLGDTEALAELELPAEAQHDLAAFRLHPSLLDLATGFALPLLAGYEQCTDLFVPLFYRAIRYFAPLHQKIYSHARLRLDSAADNGICTFDVTLCSESGEVLAEIEEFAMRRVANQSLLKGGEEKMAPRTLPTAAQRTLQDWVKEGITPSEGGEIFERVLRQTAAPQVIASPLDLDRLIAATRPVMPVKESPASGGESAQGGDPVERDLLQWWQELLGVSEIGPDDDFFELGGYSLVAVRLFAKIKRAYKVDMGIASLFEHRTVRTLAEAIRNQGQVAPPWSSLVPMRAQGTRPPLFLVHGIGGNVLGYSALVKQLPEDLPIYALQSLGLDGKQEPLTTMQEIAAHYVREIRKIQPSGPYYLAGYSFGGVAAYEMAQQLVQQGQRIALLVMIDSDRPNHEISLLESVSLSARHLFTLSPLEQKNYLARKLEAVKRRVVPSSPPEAPRPEKAQREVLQVVRAANFKAHRGYHAKPYPGSIVMMRAAEVGDSGPRLPDLGWKKFALGGMEIHTIPGNHINVYYEPNVRVLARFFTDSLYRAWAEMETEEEALRAKVVKK